jgi:hypothetical protein
MSQHTYQTSPGGWKFRQEIPQSLEGSAANAGESGKNANYGGPATIAAAWVTDSSVVGGSVEGISNIVNESGKDV